MDWGLRRSRVKNNLARRGLWCWPFAALCISLQACDTAPNGAGTSTPPPAYLAQVINPDLSGGLLVPGSHVLLIWGSDGSILRSDDGAHWTHGATDSSADLARVSSNENGSVLVAIGAKGTILRSEDAGQTWPPARNGSTDTDLKAVVHHAPSGAWIAAGTNGRILRSTDDGRTWSVVASNLTLEFQALFVDPQTHAVLIGGEQGAIGFSTDGGVSWKLTLLAMPEPATPVTGFHRFGKLLLATSALGRFMTSDDGAQSWDLLQATTKAFFTDSAFDPRHGAIVMTGHNGDMLRSTDGGHAWQGVELVIDGHKNYLSAIRFDERSGSLIVVGEGGTIARSIDGGASWAKASGDVAQGLRGLIQDSRGMLVSYGAGGMIVSSPDSGEHWKYSRAALDLSLREVAGSPEGGALIGAGRLGAVIRSVDGGASWQSIGIDYPDPNTPPDLRALDASPAGQAMIAVGPPGTILRSSPDGGTWSVEHWTSIDAERAFPWLLVDRRNKVLVAVEARGALFVSRDDGLEWQPVTVTPPPAPWPLWQGTVLERDGVMLIAGKSGSAMRSSDAARSWTIVDTGTDKDLYGSFADERSGLLFLMGQDGTLLRSVDRGITWRNVPSGSKLELRRMLRDPRSGALVCFGGHGAIVRSDDAGLTWQAVASGTDGVLRKGLIEPRTGNLLLVGGQGAILRSSDAGRSWQALPGHTTRHFTSMASDARSGDLVLVGERIVRLVRQSPRQQN